MSEPVQETNWLDGAREHLRASNRECDGTEHPAIHALGCAVEAILDHMQQLEIVICAALRDIDGSVLRCHRHHHGFAILRNRYAARSHAVVLDHVEQGFITSRNRYVDRVEGLQLQRAAGIASVDPKGYRPPELFSEDLY